MVAMVERMLELNKRGGGLGPHAVLKQTGGQRPPLPTINVEHSSTLQVAVGTPPLQPGDVSSPSRRAQLAATAGAAFDLQLSTLDLFPYPPRLRVLA